jgi:hypothetical protein
MAELSLARKTKAKLIEEVETLKRGLHALATDLDKQDVARADADRLQHLYDLSPIEIGDETGPEYVRRSRRFACNRVGYWARSTDKFLTPEEYDAFSEALAAFTRDDQSVVVACWKRAFDGEWIYLRDTIAIPSAHREDWLCVVHSVEDHTAHKHAENALEKSEAFRLSFRCRSVRRSMSWRGGGGRHRVWRDRRGLFFWPPRDSRTR